jgi:hypothetical protein
MSAAILTAGIATFIQPRLNLVLKEEKSGVK